MAATGIFKCKTCSGPFTARLADRKRGWARYCSKSCKAITQTQETGRGRPADPDWVTLTVDDRAGDEVRADSWEAYSETVHPFSSEAFES